MSQESKITTPFYEVDGQTIWPYPRLSPIALKCFSIFSVLLGIGGMVLFVATFGVTSGAGYGYGCIPLIIGIVAAICGCCRTGVSALIFDDKTESIYIINTFCCGMGRERRPLGPYRTFEECIFHSQYIPQEIYEIQFKFKDGIKSNDDGGRHLPFQKADTVRDINKWWKQKRAKRKRKKHAVIPIVYSNGIAANGTSESDFAAMLGVEGDVELA